MTQSELKENLYELVETYFGGANVVWGMTGAVNPNNPMVSLTMGDIIRHYQPIKQNADGVPVYVYPSTTRLQVDLFTKGAKTTDEPDVKTAMVNTAVNDLTDFVNYLNSIYVDNWSGANDITILANTVRDLTALTNDTSWDYRAMVELEISFTQIASGFTGIGYEDGVPYPFVPTPSGGGTQDLADQTTGWFEQVETPELIQEEDNNDG